jgi:CubicO group peptidase (beta-lactamase class C family)
VTRRTALAAVGGVGLGAALGGVARAKEVEPETRVKLDRLDARFAQDLSGAGPSAPKAGPLLARMQALKVPGLSVAASLGGRTVYAKGFGVKEVGVSDPVGPETLFQAASISKPLAALGTLVLVEQGILDLDLDVNRYLKSWRLPPSAFTTTTPVTLRRIMSHTAGLTVHGFPGYAVGVAIPTVPQILDGAPPANTAAVRSYAPPGSKTEYSGGGTTIEQLVVSDVTGQPYAEFLGAHVLAPLGMSQSGYFQPLPARLAGVAARAHTNEGAPIPGGWHIYPELAAAGLWTTPSDLMRYVQGVQRALVGGPNALLRQTTARAMITRQGPASEPSGFGLGPELKSGRTFYHSGGNEGYRCFVVGGVDGDWGVSAMTNGDNGWTLLTEVLPAMAEALDLPIERPG